MLFIFIPLRVILSRISAVITVTVVGGVCIGFCEWSLTPLRLMELARLQVH